MQRHSLLRNQLDAFPSSWTTVSTLPHSKAKAAVNVTTCSHQGQLSHNSNASSQVMRFLASHASERTQPGLSCAESHDCHSVQSTSSAYRMYPLPSVNVMDWIGQVLPFFLVPTRTSHRRP
jgi:hypothetical protein